MHLIAMLSMLLGSGWQTDDTLPALARRNHGSVTVVIDSNPPALSMASMTDESSIIVQGVVQGVSTGLSLDQRLVLTTYEITPAVYYKEQHQHQPAPLRVQRQGGTYAVDGMKLTVNDSSYPVEPLHSGDTVVLFLTRSHWDPNALRLTAGPLSALVVVRGRLSSVMPDSQPRDLPNTLEELEKWLAGRTPR